MQVQSLELTLRKSPHDFFPLFVSAPARSPACPITYWFICAIFTVMSTTFPEGREFVHISPSFFIFRSPSTWSFHFAPIPSTSLAWSFQPLVWSFRPWEWSFHLHTGSSHPAHPWSQKLLVSYLWA